MQKIRPYILHDVVGDLSASHVDPVFYDIYVSTFQVRRVTCIVVDTQTKQFHSL